MSTAESQSALWAKGARDWADVQEDKVMPLYQTVLARLQIRPGTRLLDVGCGAGLFAQLAAGQGASVAGLDATAALLRIARRRTPAGDFRQGDMESLPYPDGAFDTVTGFNSFQFAASPLNALRQARRVLDPEGTLVVAIWAAPQFADVAAALKTLAALAQPVPAGAPGPFALSGPEVLEPMVTQAGYEVVRSDEVECLWAYPDLKTLCRGLLASGPGASAKAALGAVKARQALLPAIAPFRTTDGGFAFHNRFRYVIARPRRRSKSRD